MNARQKLERLLALSWRYNVSADLFPDLPPVELPPLSGRRVILSAGAWADNGEMMADVVQLYPLTNLVVDVTWGEGAFWSEVDPRQIPGVRFVAHDLYKLDGVDWRALPEADGTVSALIFDPPYVARGGHDTSTLDSMNDAYGMLTTEENPDLQWFKIVGGIEEAGRVVKVGGLLMLKVMNYVTSTERQHFLRYAYDEMDRVGFDVIDEFLLVTKAGPQPKRNPDGTERRQVHPRNNWSALIVGRRRPDPQPALFDL